MTKVTKAAARGPTGGDLDPKATKPVASVSSPSSISLLIELVYFDWGAGANRLTVPPLSQRPAQAPAFGTTIALSCILGLIWVKPHWALGMNNTAWPRARTQAGLGDLHVHDLRHTVGMRLREAGVKEETIADILWHNRRGMTTHYSVAQIVEIRDALELITDERNRFNKST